MPFIAFSGQFLFVFLLGLQSGNVADRKYLAAAVTSTALGLCELSVLLSVVRSTLIDGGDWLTWLAFVAAGPMAICTSIKVRGWLHPRMNEPNYN